MKITIQKVAQDSPDDVSNIDALIQSNQLNPKNIIAVMGKTEGNGCVNDFTRGFTTQTLKAYFSRQTVSKPNIVYVMSGGTEGVISPHLTIISKEVSPVETDTLTGGLAAGIGRTRQFKPDEIGTKIMVEEVANTIRKILNETNIQPSDTHFVQIKCPLVTAANRQDSAVKTGDSYKSMAYSRGASALGVGVGLDEFKLSDIDESDICSNYSLYSTVASTSAGVEVQNCEIIVFGNAPHSKSQFYIQHDVMQHALDNQAIDRAMAKIEAPVESILTVFAKAEADPSGKILNRRHTMLDDSDISHTRMARAVVGASLASAIQDPMIYVSGGSEHQGPPGGGPLAIIAKLR